MCLSMSMQPLIYVDSWYLEKLYIHLYTVKQDNYSIFISYHEISYHIISYTYIYICHNYRYACIYIYKHILYMPQMETARRAYPPPWKKFLLRSSSVIFGCRAKASPSTWYPSSDDAELGNVALTLLGDPNTHPSGLPQNCYFHARF